MLPHIPPAPRKHSSRPSHGDRVCNDSARVNANRPKVTSAQGDRARLKGALGSQRNKARRSQGRSVRPPSILHWLLQSHAAWRPAEQKCRQVERRLVCVCVCVCVRDRGPALSCQHHGGQDWRPPGALSPTLTSRESHHMEPFRKRGLCYVGTE
ncbi:hypothetical protein HJG60_011136 [Phyllostomus discolor]|uniref:Uncharacterized protein n=1 Tax=Phyllostomus discolor TaxID=89673 RepID=A0A834A3X1_9CHIR|nr:hypothetical protein HJG60_011136 [Phyllostomus discolor]